MRSIEHCDVPDAGYQLTLGLLGQLAQQRVARLAIAGAHPHLDQFMIVQSTLGLGCHAGAKACLADHDHRLERMSLAAQELELFF